MYSRENASQCIDSRNASGRRPRRRNESVRSLGDCGVPWFSDPFSLVR